MPQSVIQRLVLASESPFRKQLLASTGLQFETARSAVDETAITAETPGALASARGEAKALAVANERQEALIIGADQVLSLGNRSFDKAADAVSARARLAEFSGKTHVLETAYCLAYKPAGGKARLLTSRLIRIAMPMRSLSDAELDAYVATGEWQGCVGCYRYEERGVSLFEAVQAEHSAIVGLPLAPLLADLRAHGVDPLLHPAPPWPGF